MRIAPIVVRAECISQIGAATFAEVVSLFTACDGGTGVESRYAGANSAHFPRVKQAGAASGAPTKKKQQRRQKRRQRRRQRKFQISDL